MILLIDIGNSALKWTICKDNTLSVSRSFLHDSHIRAEQLDSEWGELEAPVRVVIASVMANHTHAELEEWITGHWQAEINFLAPTGEAAGVSNGYRDPSQLGIDRWAAIVAAFNIHKGGCLIVDCGTATTLDVVDEYGDHQGGLIIPGVDMMMQSLARSTALLSLPESQSEVSGLGRTTDEAISTGVIESLAVLVEAIWRRWNAKSDREMAIIVTGGNAENYLQVTELTCHHVPDLVIRGIALLDGNCLEEQQI